MRTVTFTIKSSLDLSDKEIVEELLLAETRMNSDSKLRFHLSQESIRIDELEKKIEAYKKICRLADIPKFIVDNPEVAIPFHPTKEDIQWARKSILEHAESK